MKLILYMAISVNGMVAKLDGDSDWVSPENTSDFYETCQRIGAVIMGKNTYDLLNPEYLPLKEGIQVVLTHSQGVSDNNTVMFTGKSPQAIIELLKAKGCKEACVIGGPQTATLFFKEKLINEIIINVEPMLLGKGMPILAGEEFEYKVSLLEAKHLSKDTMQLHYTVEY